MVVVRCRVYKCEYTPKLCQLNTKMWEIIKENDMIILISLYLKPFMQTYIQSHN